MAAKQTAAKMKYNRETYRRFEFNLRLDSRLLAILERYRETEGKKSNLSALIKTCLCEHFGLTEGEADAIFAPYWISSTGERIINHELDKYFTEKSE